MIKLLSLIGLVVLQPVISPADLRAANSPSEEPYRNQTLEDYIENQSWLAAENGNSVAQLSLGSMYFLGKGVKKDYEKAFEW
jgi:TPR repeat protein